MALTATSWDERLTRRILQGEGSEVQATLTFFEHHDPVTLDEAVELLEPYGRVTPEAFEQLARAWSIYWHQRYMSWD